MDYLPFFSLETWILLITCIGVFVMYGKVTFKTFEKLGIPAPKPIMCWGTVGRHNAVCYIDDKECAKYGKVWGFWKQNKQNINQYTYLPFGFGPRNCIGMRFALVMVKLALVEVLQNYRFSVCEETEIPFTMDPEGLVGPLKPIKLKLVTHSVECN